MDENSSLNISLSRVNNSDEFKKRKLQIDLKV